MPLTTSTTVYPTSGAKVLAPFMLEVTAATYTAANDDPTVAVVSPVEGAIIAAGTDVLVQISAADTDGTIETVELLVDGALAVNASPQPAVLNGTSGYYETTLSIGSGATLGDHTLQGRATDDGGAIVTSAVRTIEVVAEGTADTAFTNFGTDTTGALPAWLTQRWVTANSSATVVVDGAALGGKVLRVVQTAGQRTAWSFSELGGVTLGTPADVEILVKLRVSVVTATTSIIGTVVRGAGSAASETGYMAAFRNTSDDFRIHGFNAGANLAANVVVANTPNPVADTWYYIRHRISGNVHKAKLWAATDAEPTTWTLGDDGTAVESTISAGGWPALFTFAAATHDFDYVAVGLNGATAPMPV